MENHVGPFGNEALRDSRVGDVRHAAIDSEASTRGWGWLNKRVNERKATEGRLLIGRVRLGQLATEHASPTKNQCIHGGMLSQWTLQMLDATPVCRRG